MEIAFDDPDLDRLETDDAFTGGHGPGVVRAYRKVIGAIRVMRDERFEKLKGSRDGQYSIRLNDQWRLILEFEGEAPQKVVRLIEIVDYH